MVQRGTYEVMRSVVGNEAARFSNAGYNRLVRHAGKDAELRKKLDRRSDLPATIRERLTDLARRRATTNLSREFGEGAAVAVSNAVEAVRAFEGANARLVEETVDAKLRESGIDEMTMITWLNEGNNEAAVVALARLAKAPMEIARVAYGAESYEPLMFLVRSVPLGWRVLGAFMAAKAGRSMPPEVMHGALEAFQTLSVQTAQRVVRFTIARNAVGHQAIGV